MRLVHIDQVLKIRVQGLEYYILMTFAS